MKKTIVDALSCLVFDKKKGYQLPDHEIGYESGVEVMIIHLLIQIRNLLEEISEKC